MAEQSFPFENIDTTESQFSEWATNFQETGVQGSPDGTELTITVTGSDLNLTVAAGQAFIRGHYYINTSDLVIAVPTAGVNTRIDIVVVELNPETNTIVTKLVQGEAVSADPVAPTLTQSPTGVYQLPIATLTIPTSTVAITAGMLVDTRTFMGNRIGIWTTATRPANPTAYQTLGYNTTIGSHESWNGTAWVGFFDPISTAGDLVVGDGTGQASRLGVGTDDQVLTVVSGAPAWADGPASGLYFKFTGPGTFPVNLPAGLYRMASLNSITVEGVVIDGEKGLVNYPDGIDDLVVPEIFGTFISPSSDFPTNRDLRACTYGNGSFIIFGQSGNLSTSTNSGVSFNSRTSGVTDTIQAAGYGDGLYLGGTFGGDIITSPNGDTWTTRSPWTGTDGVNDITYGDGLYVACANFILVTSPDGASWTTRTSGFASGDRIEALGYGNGLYLAGGFNGTLTTSTDGITWTNRTSGFGTDRIQAIGYGGGVYVAAGYDGKLTTSTDGITWTNRTSGFGTSRIVAVAYGDGLFMVTGDAGKITTSPDGITWTNRTSGFGTDGVSDVTIGEGKFVIVGGGYDGGYYDLLGVSTGLEPTDITLSIEPKLPVTNLP